MSDSTRRNVKYHGENAVRSRQRAHAFAGVRAAHSRCQVADPCICNCTVCDQKRAKDILPEGRSIATRIEELERALKRAIGTIETECDDSALIAELEAVLHGD